MNIWNALEILVFEILICCKWLGTITNKYWDLNVTMQSTEIYHFSLLCLKIANFQGIYHYIVTMKIVCAFNNSLLA